MEDSVVIYPNLPLTLPLGSEDLIRISIASALATPFTSTTQQFGYNNPYPPSHDVTPITIVHRV